MVVNSEMVIPPNSGLSISSIVPAIVLRQPNDLISEEVLTAGPVVLLVIDGLGWNQLERHKEHAPCLHSASATAIVTTAPSTTATALTTLSTGVAPGEHGIVGYKVRTPQGLLNCLRWTTNSRVATREISPIDFQPIEPFLGAKPPVVTRAEFRTTGFTEAHLRNGRFCGWWSPATLVTEIVDQIERGAPFVYAYYDGLDKIGHVHGLQRHYLAELRFIDALIARTIEELPDDVTLLVTADHGMVEVGQNLITLDPDLIDRTSSTSGEARFLWLHTKGKPESGLLEASEIHSDVAWVVGIEQVLDEQWFGSFVSPEAKARLGDVAIVARESVGLIDPRLPDAPQMIARHGSLTEEEMIVPFLRFSP
ncbi:MAG: alkaline phosphatase family protein [Acidimicrobiales bacterium]|nr:alkaline phosphatase family protein [Acidimicrobiales bacterium]